MTCPTCNQAVPPGARFCSECGSALARSCPACGAAVEGTPKFCKDCGAPFASSGGTPSSVSTSASTPTPMPPVAAVPESFGAGRYQVSRFLGEGGRKRVYQAYDRALDREVAVATVKTEDLDTAGLERVRREAQAMGRLGDHPHIVTVYDIGEEEGRPYIVSQYMPGGSVDDLLVAASEHRLPVEDAIRIADEVAQALEHAHGLGIVHRDIKPANVWLTEGGSTRLGDFGLASAAVSPSRSRLTKEGMMVGTVAYMAPEQALGQAVDSRADLYSLGALLYELLTGRPPFVGPDAVAVISQQINTPPMAPWWHNPAVPKELGTLVLDLLAKTPEERPADAGEVRRRLLNALALTTAPDGEASLQETPAPADTRHTARLNRLSRFVGRANELRDLKRAVEGALAGRGALVMVSGEPGIGKTRLAEEAGVYARLGGAQVIVGRSYEAESSVSYMPFIEALRAYVTSRPAEDLRAELGDAASEVAKLVSEVRAIVPGLSAASRPSGDEERYRLFESVCSFLVNASRSTPIMLLLDDLHWADAPSLRLLQHLSRRLADSRLLVVGTYRDIELSRRHPLAQALAELRRDQSFQRIVLRGLSLSEVQDFLEGLTERPLDPAEQPLAAAFYGETEGNPYFLEEIARHLLETGGAFWEGGRWKIDKSSVESLAIPEGIQELITRRLSRLSEAGIDVLTRAAVLGAQFDFAVLEHMTGLADDALLAALEEALEAQVIEQAETARGHALYRFAHAVIRQSLYEGLSLPRRQRLHRRAAEAIEEVQASNLGPHLPALALHYRQAGTAADPAKAVEYSVKAGEVAMGVFAYEDAAQHWEAALDLLADAGADAATEAAVLARLGDLTFISGLDFERSTACLQRALALYESLERPDRVAQMHSRLGRNLGTTPSYMDIPKALAHYRAAEAIVSEEPESNALGYVCYGQCSTASWALRTEEGLAAADRALAVAGRVGNDRLRRHVTAHQGVHLTAAGRLAEGVAVLDRTWAEADAARDGTAAFTSAWAGAMVLFALCDPGESRSRCLRELATPRQSLARAQRRILLDVAGQAAAVAGDLAAARRERDEVGDSRYVAPFLAFHEGRLDEAAALWEALAEADERSGNRFDQWTSTSRLGVVRRLEGRSGDAERLLVEALALATDGGQRIMEIWTRTELAVLLADVARTRDARQYLDRALELVGTPEDWRGLGGRVLLAEAAVLWAEGKGDAADLRAMAAIEVFRRIGLPWDEADAERRLGQARHRVRDRAGAVRRFAAALELYRRHGAGDAWIEPVVAEKLEAQGVDSLEVMTSVHLVAAAVEQERPDLAPLTSPEGTVTLLFSDIEGSTAANARLGDRRWMEMLRVHNQIVRDEVAGHGGFEVKSQGDGFMVAFSSARRGLASAVAIQRALHARAETHPEEAIRVRMGLHTGEALKEGDDFFGTHVALAARIAAVARGGEILVSSLLKELTESSGDLVFGPGRDVDLKGFSGSRRIYPLRWEEEPEGPGEIAAPSQAHGDVTGAASAAPAFLVTLLVTDAEPGDDVVVGVAAPHGEILALEGRAAVAFAAAADAVAAAVRLQGAGPGLRIALHTGGHPAEDEPGGQSALAVARELCDRAEPGQVLCSGVVAGRLAGRPRLAFAALGGADGDGTSAVELRTESGGGPVSSPPELISRQAETARFVERLQETANQRGGLVMLAGEQGAGKTRLADEIATRAEREGFTVLWGRCHEGEWPPPYGPFVEALDAHAGLLDPAELGRDLGEAAGVVAQMVPAVRRALPDAAAVAVPPEEERHRLIDGIGQFLVARSRRAPLVVLLDDLHWAERSTVALLRHLARLAAPERMLLIGTYRDVDLDRAHPLTDALAAWPREAGYEHLRIECLDGEETAAFLAAAAGGPGIELKVGAAWARETGGNPFFVLELLRHLIEEGTLYRGSDGRWATTAPLRDLALPVAARDVALKRVSRLSEAANRLLGVAAAFERAFRFDVVADIAGLSEDDGLDALEEAIGARILEPSGDSESYAFTHAVIRHALYDGLVPSRRSRLHRRVAEALTAAPAGVSAAEIAVHYHRSVALPGAHLGVEPAIDAADHAQATGAYDEAATFLRMALDMLPTGDTRRPRLLGRLGIILAWALAFDDAVSVGAEAGDAIAEAETKQAAAEYLGDAAYACASAGGIVASWDLARRGLTFAGARDVAWARMICFDYQRREAEDPDHPGIPIDSAERREAAAILRAAHLDPIGPAPMEAVFDSREEAAASSNLIVLGVWAGEWTRIVTGLEAEAVEAESLGRLSRAARAWGSLAVAQAALGRLADARESFERAQGLAARLGTPVGTLLFPQYLLCVTVDEGWEQLATTFGFLQATGDPALAWALGFGLAGFAQAKAHLGESDEALAAVGRLIPWLERAPAWTMAFGTMACAAAEVLWFLDRTDHLAAIELALREKLLPSGFRTAMADGRHALACCCALSGRYDEAGRWFTEARLVLTERGAAAHLAVCDFDEALMLARRGGPGDAGAAADLAKAAGPQFEALGMTGWLRRARDLEATLPEP